VQANAVGWVALGLSLNGQMSSNGVAPGSDIFMGFLNTAVSGCTAGCIHDYSTVRYALPELDAQQNVDFVSFSEQSGVTQMEFGRRLSTGDTVNDQVLDPAQSHWVLWSLQDSVKPIDAATFSKHTFRNSLEMTFSQRSSCSPSGARAIMTLNVDPKTYIESTFVNNLAAEMQIEAWRILITDTQKQDAVDCPNCVILDFAYSNYTVPSSKTTYVCYGFQFPQDKKYHVVRFEPLRDNAQVVHHMLLYTATTQPAIGYQTCSTMPSNTNPMWGWAPGGSALNVPDVTGFPVGLGEANYAILQIHYDNPQGLSTFKDSSGVRMYLTATLRSTDAAFMFLGVNTGSIVIPAGHSAWHQSASCPSQATSQLNSNIQVFASGLHMHTHGRRIWTEHFRGSTQLPDLGNNQHYDFNSQTFVPVNVTIARGDSLVTHCIWDNSNSTTNVVGGEDTFKEMCLNAILYYPKKPVGSCTYAPTAGI